MPRKPELSEIVNPAQTLRRRMAEAEEPDPDESTQRERSSKVIENVGTMTQSQFGNAGPKPSRPPPALVKGKA